MTGDAATILIVDDEPPIRRLLRSTLAAHDHKTLEAIHSLSVEIHTINEQQTAILQEIQKHGG